MLAKIFWLQWACPTAVIAVFLRAVSAVQDGYLLTKTLGKTPLGGHLLNTVMQKVGPCSWMEHTGHQRGAV